MDKNFGQVGMVRDSLLAKTHLDPRGSCSANHNAKKDLNLNLDRVSAYSHSNKKADYCSESSLENSVVPDETRQQTVVPPVPSDIVDTKIARVALQPIYAAIATLALFNIAFVGWILLELSDISRLVVSTAQAGSSIAQDQRISTYDSSIDTLQLAVSALRNELLLLDSKLSQSTDEQLETTVPTPALLDSDGMVAATDRDTAASSELEVKASTKTAVNKPNLVLPVPEVGAASGLSATPKEGAVNKTLQPKTPVKDDERVLVHSPNENTVTENTNTKKIAAKKTWLVNLGTFSSEEAAETVRENVSALGYNVRIVRTNADNKSVLKVQLGDFSSWRSAQSIVDQLESKTGITGLWVSRLN